MVSWGKGEMVVRSRLKELVYQRERELGDRLWQKDIAKATGLTEKTISRWMSPEPFTRLEVDAIIRLCRYFNVDLGELIYMEETKSAQQ